MRLLSAVAVVVAAVAVGAPVEPSQRCDPDYDCKWTHVDQVYGTLYDFDFSHHCSPVGYRIDDANNHTYFFNICGTSPERCLPQGYTSRYLHGAAVQTFGPTPACDLTNLPCFDKVENKSACCTANCEVLGVGTPVWELLDETNPTTGGVKLTHQGVPPSANDPNRCPLDPKTGAEKQRSVTILLHCNPSLPANELVEMDAYENSTCEYVIEVETAAACGCAPNCNGKTCGKDGCGGFCSGPQMFGQCPYGQECNLNTGVCCRPDCTNRDCGGDGCGGSCGVCGPDETCSSALVCIESTPFIPTSAAVYKVDSGSLAGAFFGGILVAAVLGAVGWFFLGTGRTAFDRWRFGASGGGSTGSDRASLIGNNTSSTGTTLAAAESGGLASASRGYGT